MPKSVLSRDDALVRLAGVFRRHGYDGASLSRMREATGLKSSSLYHYFPRGKQDMGEAVLSWADDLFEAHALAPLRAPGPPANRLAAFLESLRNYYDGGRASCLLNLFGLGEAHDLYGEHLNHTMRRLLKALATLAEEAGASPAEAAMRAEDAVIAIEGSLVLCRALGGTAPFERVVTRLPALLLPQI